MATKKSESGYITTADYRGIVSKVIDGKVIYTAYFDGVLLDGHYENLENKIISDHSLNTLLQNTTYEFLENESVLNGSIFSEEEIPQIYNLVESEEPINNETYDLNENSNEKIINSLIIIV